MLDEKEFSEQMFKYMLFKSAASRGANIQPMIETGRVHPSQLTTVNKMDLYTNQFMQNWLNTYKMEDISWIVCQFPELASARK